MSAAGHPRPPEEWEQRAIRIAAALNTARDELDRLLEGFRARRADDDPKEGATR